MGIYLADQTVYFLQSLLLGAALAVVYDVFRITRIAVPTPRAVVFAEDVVFFLICAVSTFFFLLSSVDGRVRFFLLIGELLGAILYYFTLGQLVMRVSRGIIRIVKGIFRFFYRWFLFPIWRLVYNIVFLLTRPLVFLGKFLLKLGRKAKFSLKVRQRMLYNHCTGFFLRRNPRVHREKKDGIQTQEP